MPTMIGSEPLPFYQANLGEAASLREEPWPVDAAFAYLGEHAGRRFDRRCVAGLVEHRGEIESIQARFREDPLG